MNELDKIKDKVKKLIALSQRGEGGEAANAEKLVSDLCKRYNIDTDSLVEDSVCERYFNVGRGKEIRRIFVQCYAKVMDAEKITYYEGGSRIVVSLPTSKFLELSAFWEWHKSNFKAELKRIRMMAIDAYIYKHRLWNESLTSQPEREISEEEAERVRNMLKLASVLDDKEYRKMLE